MPNPYFQFKQFIIHQDRCAMKVGTDGVLLGAWTNVDDAERILDIGTGTGVIALMMAQKSPAAVDAVEIEENAFRQACENVGNSPWKNRVTVFHQSFQKFADECKHQYDLIVSNPPFFEKAFVAPSKTRTLARHNHGLPLRDLFSGVKKLLGTKGSFFLILPFQDLKKVLEEGEMQGLYLNNITYVRPTTDKPPNRILLSLKTTRQEGHISNELVIHIGKQHGYTEEYKHLTRDYYLLF